MGALQPREVRRAHVLIIAEQERVPRVVVTDIGPSTVDLERGNATLKPIRAVGAGDFKDVQPEVRNDVEALRAEPLTRVANVCVQNDPRIERVSPSDAYDINQSGSCPQLSAIQSRAAHLTKYRGVNDQRGRTAVAAKERELLRHVVDLGIHVGAVELAYASGCEVVCEAGLVR